MQAAPMVGELYWSSSVHLRQNDTCINKPSQTFLRSEMVCCYSPFFHFSISSGFIEKV